MNGPVAILVNALGPGGAERVVLTICAELVRRGRQVDLICLEPDIAYEMPAGIIPIILGGGLSWPGGLGKLLALPVLARRLAVLSRERGYRIVQSHLFRANYVNVLSRSLGASHGVQVVNHTKPERLLSEGLSGKANAFLTRRLYPRADTIVAISRRMSADMAAFLGVPEDRILTIHNPYDTEKVRELALLQDDSKIPTRNGRRFIAAMGRLVSLKRFGDVLKAFAIVAATRADVDLVILGEGPERKNLEAQTATLGLSNRVFMPGFSSNPYRVLSMVSVFALASETEGFPNAIIEALALGTPVISTDCISGPREILAPASDWRLTLLKGQGVEDAAYGLLVPVCDIEALSDGLSRILDDATLAARLSRNGPGRADEFSASVIVDAYDQLLFPETP